MEQIQFRMTDDGRIIAEYDGCFGRGATVEEALAYLRGAHVHGLTDTPVPYEEEEGSHRLGTAAPARDDTG